MNCNLCNKPLSFPNTVLCIPFDLNVFMVFVCTECTFNTIEHIEGTFLRKDKVGTYVWIGDLGRKCINGLVARNDLVTSYFISQYNTQLINQLRFILEYKI